MIRFLFCFFLFNQLLAYSKTDVEAEIGVRTLEYVDEVRNRPIVVEVWYPTSAKATQEGILSDIWIHPLEVRDAPLLKGPSPHPLLLISHGHGGQRRDHTWLVERFVREGYMIAAVDHYGNTRKVFKPEISLRFWERPKDITFVLDRLLEHPFFSPHIDQERIGFAGYSLGGMTGLALAGGVAGPMDVAIKKHRLRMPHLSEESLSKMDFQDAQKSYVDRRFSAFLLIAPANFVYQPEGLKGVKAPIGLVSAINDEVVSYKDHAYTIIQHIVPHKLKVLRREISHYSFLNQLSDFGKKILPEHIRAEAPCCAREQIHQEVADFAIRFFRDVWKK